jgi:hypothetical protein
MKFRMHLLFHVFTEFAVAVEQILVLVSVAGQNIFNERLRPVEDDFIVVPAELYI